MPDNPSTPIGRDFNCTSRNNTNNKICRSEMTTETDVFVRQTSLKTAKKNLKKLEKIYEQINLVNYKTIPTTHKIHYEHWFMFMDEIIQIQKKILDRWQNSVWLDIMSDVGLLIKPQSDLSPFCTTTRHQIWLCISTTPSNL